MLCVLQVPAPFISPNAVCSVQELSGRLVIEVDGDMVTSTWESFLIETPRAISS